MTSTTLRPIPPVRIGPLVLLLAIAAGAWTVTAVRMDGMDAGPGTELGELGWFMVVWVTMTAAMMLPAAAPSVLAMPRARLAPFFAAYLAAWAAAGLVGYLIVEGVRGLEPAFLAWDEAGRYAAGGALVAAGLYQLTPVKQACLRRCRQPAEIDYGAYCVGCAWALMGALFALGVMSVGWMAFVAALIAAERLLPWRKAGVRAVAVVLVALGLAVALVPEDVPGLTVPGSGDSMMEDGGRMMEMEP